MRFVVVAWFTQAGAETNTSLAVGAADEVLTAPLIHDFCDMFLSRVQWPKILSLREELMVDYKVLATQVLNSL